VIRAALALLLIGSAASADTHGSVGLGGSLQLTGVDDGASRLRADGELDVIPFGRYGGLVALRGADRDHHGLLCAGLLFEAAVARPTLAMDLHADVGADLDVHAPLVGGGLRITLAIVGPLGVALDTTGELVLDGLDHTRLVIAGSTMLVARW
jgi:hypothetical protein